MSRQPPLLRKEEVKSPAVFLFGAVYVFALVLALQSSPSQVLGYVGLSLGILLLVWLIIGITEKVQIADIQIGKPGLELAFAGLVFLVFVFVRFPRLGFGEKWALSSILNKELLLFALPCAFLRFRKNSLSSMGLSLLNWKHNLRIGCLIFACMAIPSAFFVSNSARLILGGQLTLAVAVPGFFLLFLHNIALSGLPEEFFFRAFAQTRISILLKSKLGGILLTSLWFGLIHIDDLMRWYPNMTVSGAFCRAFFIQGFLGLVFGVLWARTHNLIPGIIVHSGINALNNLGSLPSLLML